MSNKKWMILSIFLITLFAVSAVSATDNSTSDIVSAKETTDDVVIVEDDQDNIMTSEADSNLILKATDNNPKTFTELNEIINGNNDTDIFLDSNFTFDSKSDSGGVVINRSVTIHGNGHTIDGDKTASIFSADNHDIDVVLRGIVFVNGNSASYGGAIGGIGNVVNCTFVNNSAENGGGAIEDIGNVVNCTFIGNSAENGGAILLVGSVVNCTFVNNSAENGGAIFGCGPVVNCTFVGNSAGREGGAILEVGNVVNCTFVGNSAYYGGAMYDCSAVNCTFVNNSANDYYQSGGAMYGGSAVNCTFVGNSAYYGGGAISSGSAVNCTFVNNFAKNGGGAMYRGSAVNCNFVNNSAKNGGAMYGGSAVNCNFINNTVVEYGGAMYECSAVNCTFVGNSAVNGGAMYGGSAVNCAFINNSAFGDKAMYCGAIYGGSAVNCTFVGNSASTKITSQDITVAYKGSCELVATLTNAKTGNAIKNVNIIVNINGVNYTLKTDSKGKASISIPTLKPGKYTATIKYNGSSNYEASTAKAKITVTKAATSISAPNVNIAYKDPNGKLVITVTNEHGKTLSVYLNVNLNGKDYALKTNSKGQASISINTLKPGKYTASIKYNGSSNYKASTAKAKVTVTKAGTVISAPKVNVAYKDSSGKLAITVTNEHGKTLSVYLNVNLNGKDYAVKTNTKGEVSIPIDTLKPGKYTATITYKGSDNYKASNTTAKVTVTKAATSISSPDVTVKYKDSKGKLVSTITNEYGSPLAVNLNVDINGKIYTAKTDSKGQMSMSTADLAPGTYTATISYKGNGNYKPSSTTANIKVKK